MPDWTNPRTWVSNETVTAAEMNTYVSDNLSYLYSPDAVGCYKSTDQTVTSGSWEVVNLDTEEFITRSRLHGGAGNTSRLGPGGDGRGGYAGRYLYIAHVEFESDSTGNYRRVQIRKNSAGSGVGGNPRGVATTAGVGGGVPTAISLSRIITMSSGDYCEMFVQHDASTNIKASGGIQTLFFQCHYLGN